MFRFLHLQGGFTEWKEKADPSEIEWFFFLSKSYWKDKSVISYNR